MFKLVQSIQNWPQIQEQLIKISKKQLGCEQISQKLIYFEKCSEKTKPLKLLKFKITNNALIKQYGNEMQAIFSQIAIFILKDHSYQIPLFLQNQPTKANFTKQQILYLLCLMSLNLVPKQEYDKTHETRKSFSHIMNFSYIFSENIEKTKFLIQYLKKSLHQSQKQQVFTLERVCVNKNTNELILDQKQTVVCQMEMKNDKNSIENQFGSLKIDFANKFIGGGALTYGFVQEEIMFMQHPEMIISQLLCEVMRPNEAIIFIGFRKYFNHQAYHFDTTFDGEQQHKYEYNGELIAKEYIAAIDAEQFHKIDKARQFSKMYIDRQILKAYSGFKIQNNQITSIATGNWGCGAFGGDLRLKFMIQWIASSLVKRKLIYCPFGYQKQIYDQSLIKVVSKYTIGQLYRILVNSAENMSRPEIEAKISIYEKMKKEIGLKQ